MKKKSLDCKFNYQDVIESWDHLSNIPIEYEPPFYFDTLFDEIINNYAKRKKVNLVDLGTGTGRVVFRKQLYSRCEKVIGIDILSKAVSLSREKIANTTNVEFIVGDVEHLPFRDNIFDMATAHFSPFSPEEVHRILVKKGKLITMTGFRNDHRELSEIFLKNKLISQLERGTSDQWIKKLEKAGFEIIGNIIFRYKWVFKNIEQLKKWYSIVRVFPTNAIKSESLNRLRMRENGKIPISREIGIIVGEK